MRNPLLRSLLQPLVEFIYPPTCFVCEASMEGGESRVCSSCWSTIGALADDDPLYREMLKRLKENPACRVSNLISLYHFEKDGTLQSIIHQLKYEGMTSLGVELGRKLGEKLRTQFPDHSIDGIVPVPLHAIKVRERGYNQSDHVNKGIHEMTGLPVYGSLLRRHKYTISQTQLTAAERKQNVGDAFSLNKRHLVDVKRKTLLIVDDVITTGATIEACADVLMNADAQGVIACAVALAEHSSLP